MTLRKRVTPRRARRVRVPGETRTGLCWVVGPPHRPVSAVREARLINTPLARERPPPRQVLINSGALSVQNRRQPRGLHRLPGPPGSDRKDRLAARSEGFHADPPAGTPSPDARRDPLGPRRLGVSTARWEEAPRTGYLGQPGSVCLSSGVGPSVAAAVFGLYVLYSRFFSLNNQPAHPRWLPVPGPPPPPPPPP